jgi:surface antigen
MDASRILASTGAFLAVITLCRWSEAANICSETVPANRMVDGIPAYSQCTASTSSAIYSNNGADTATASGGTGWVRTQMSGGYQCTELAHRYMYFKWNVQSVPNGNAGVWCNGTIPSGLVKETTPVHGDLIVFAPGSCGADATTGHVAVVDVVNADSTVTFVEQNGASRRKCQVSTAACFLHAVANTGASVDGGADAATDTPSPGNDGAPVPTDVSRRFDSMGLPDRTPISTGGSDGAAASGGTLGTRGCGWLRRRCGRLGRCE